jgi:hypothetical protein
MDIPTLGLDASEQKSEGYERALPILTIVNKLHIFSRLFIYLYIESVVVVIKTFNYFIRCNPSY